MNASALDIASGAVDPALRQQFLTGMSHAACTVNVVTTDGIAGRHGVTVSAMVSVSADTPQPTLLVCIHHLSPAAAAVLENGVFCVNVLREDQVHISDSFAGRSGAHGVAKFDCANWTAQITGAPRVVDSLVAFDCRVTASERVGSHLVVFGLVQDIFVSGGGAPLIYANRAYGVPQQLRQAAPPMLSASAGSLSIGCFQIFAPYVLPRLLARLSKDHPGIALKLFESDQSQLLSSLRHGDIDIALLYDFGLDDEMHTEQLAELTPYVLLPESHALAANQSISLRELAREPLVLLDVAPSRDYFLSLFRDQGLEPLVGYRTNNFETVRGLVGHGLGYGLLATKPANNMTYDGRALVARPLTDSVRNSRLVLAHLSRRSLSVHAQVFAGYCRTIFTSDQSASKDSYAY